MWMWDEVQLVMTRRKGGSKFPLSSQTTYSSSNERNKLVLVRTVTWQVQGMISCQPAIHTHVSNQFTPFFIINFTHSFRPLSLSPFPLSHHFRFLIVIISFLFSSPCFGSRPKWGRIKETAAGCSQELNCRWPTTQTRVLEIFFFIFFCSWPLIFFISLVHSLK